MHFSSLDNFQMCLKKHVIADPQLGDRSPLKILDVGSADINGSYRQCFAQMKIDYTGVDLESGRGVSVVLKDPYVFPFADGSFDLVYAGQVFEHAEFFWKLFAEMCRVTTDDGVLMVLSPATGPVHRYPVDCYRFMPDAMQALANFAEVHLVDAWTSPYGPFNDAVGVFRKKINSPSSSISTMHNSSILAPLIQNDFPPNVPSEVERGAGTQDCYDFLVHTHELLKPQFYLEIGVEYGNSLRLAKCDALGIDPAPQLTAPLMSHQKLVLTTSDDFFRFADTSEIKPIDLAYIDGMHQIEYVLRDFMYIERFCHKNSVVIIDDIYPTHPLQGQRIRQSRFWTGDVWKLIGILQLYRSDLTLIPLDTSPTGSLMILGLNPANNGLWNVYDLIMEVAIAESTHVPQNILQRTEKFDPCDPLIDRILGILRSNRENDTDGSCIDLINSLIAGSLPRVIVK